MSKLSPSDLNDMIAELQLKTGCNEQEVCEDLDYYVAANGVYPDRDYSTKIFDNRRD